VLTQLEHEYPRAESDIESENRIQFSHYSKNGGNYTDLFNHDK
jgi:hypothetical protein